MTLTIGGYKVHITAEDPFCKDKEQATMYFLNQMSAYCTEAARQYHAKNYDGLGREAERCGLDIYKELKIRGLYDEKEEAESA